MRNDRLENGEGPLELFFTSFFRPFSDEPGRRQGIYGNDAICES